MCVGVSMHTVVLVCSAVRFDVCVVDFGIGNAIRVYCSGTRAHEIITHQARENGEKERKTICIDVVVKNVYTKPLTLGPIQQHHSSLGWRALWDRTKQLNTQQSEQESKRLCMWECVWESARGTATAQAAITAQYRLTIEEKWECIEENKATNRLDERELFYQLYRFCYDGNHIPATVCVAAVALCLWCACVRPHSNAYMLFVGSFDCMRTRTLLHVHVFMT